MVLRNKRGRAWAGFGLASLMVAAAALIRGVLLASLGTRAQYVTFFPAVMITALYGGLYAGLLATVLSAGAVFAFWMELPGLPFLGQNPPDLLGMGVFLASCTMISCICEAMHRAQSRAVAAEAQAQAADERRRAEEAVREAYHRLNLHVENSPLAVVEWDSDFHITRWAGGAPKVFGWAISEVIGKRIDELPWVFKEDLPLVNQTMADMLTGKSPSNINSNRNVRKDGTVIHCEWYNTAIHDASGRLISVLSQVLDVTERKKAEEDLRQAKDDLEKRVRERTVELSQTVETLEKEVSRRILAEHDLRERSEQLRLLASELTMGEQRERKRLAAVLHDHLQQLLVAAKFSIFSLKKAKEEKISQGLTELEAILDSSIETTRSLTAELGPPILRDGGLLPALEWLARRMKEKHGLTVEISAPQDAIVNREELRVLLFEAIRELLFNVVKHSGNHTARVQVRRLGTILDVLVTDEGVGFDPANILAGRPSTGGLGLFGIRERINLMGGSMEIGSAKGKGASFRLTVPAD
jgi:PAS domain S-box-containing protein